jgi:hypothetical protein
LCFRWLNEKADRSTQDRCYRICEQPTQRGTLRPAIFQHETYGVHSVRAVMREDGNGHRNADARRRLEADPERQSVHEAVHRETARTGPAALFGRRVVPVHKKKPVGDRIGEEADRGDGKERFRRIMRAPESQSLRKEIEEGESDHGARAEGQDQMEAILKAQRGEPAEERRAEGAEGDGQNGQRKDGRSPARIAIRIQGSMVRVLGRPPPPKGRNYGVFWFGDKLYDASVIFLAEARRRA